MGNLILFLRDHGLHVGPILIAGAFALAIFAERSYALILSYPLRGSTRFFERIRELVLADRLTEAISTCDRYRGKLLARVAREGLMRAHQPEAMVEDGLQLALGDAGQLLSKRTQFLSLIANVSTLLGLFGTILGLIHSFEAVGSASAQQKAALLAAGISTSMNATMLGLGVAIPCMVAFAFLTNLTNRMSAELEQGATRILDFVRQRAYAAEADPSSKAPPGTPFGAGKRAA